MAVAGGNHDTTDGGGMLWLVATPIGTLDDLAPRAAAVLAEADLICAEDTRRTATLLRHLGIDGRGRMWSLHEHNEAARTARVLDRLAAGAAVALVSDAGTPVLSDPGFALVREARRRGIRVASVPGPSAFVAALAASGQPPLPATLVGFLPPRKGARTRSIADLATLPTTLVILLSPHRLAAELADLADGLGSGRRATLLAELSKLHERGLEATLGELAAADEAAAPRGEYVLVIGPPAARPAAEGPPEAVAAAVRAAYDAAVAGGAGRADALRAAARTVGMSRRHVFDILADDETST
jgi:16S rRNA (cytidine1402-2'-O)-methyltransferase